MFMRGEEIMNQDLPGIEAADIAVDYVEIAESPIIVRGNVSFMDETQCWLQVAKLIGFSPLRLDAEARCRKGAIVPDPNGDDAHVGRQVLRWGRIAEEKPVHGRIPAAGLKEEPHPRGPGAKPGNDDANARKSGRQGGRICTWNYRFMLGPRDHNASLASSGKDGQTDHRSASAVNSNFDYKAFREKYASVFPAGLPEIIRARWSRRSIPVETRVAHFGNPGFGNLPRSRLRSRSSDVAMALVRSY